jgi:Tol biopolymer transport system component
MMNSTWKGISFRMTGALLALGLIAFMLPGCAKKIEQGDPAPLLALLRCSDSCDVAAVNNDFSTPVPVTINSYTGVHAMEPSISRDGAYLFFNSLNDGIDTSLYYASRVSETEFTSNGKINGVNGTPRHLDAVPSMDTSDNFYFISLRNYLTNYLNVFTFKFTAGTGTAPQPLAGDFYIEKPGWLIMDGEVSPDGNDFYFVNAHFSGQPVPDRSDIGVAHKSGASFFKDANSATIMALVNTGQCLEYAPSISNDGKELYFTRLDLCKVQSAILVAKRALTSDPFGAPERIGAITGFVEAPSLTFDGKTLYYHKKVNGIYSIYKVSRP